MSAPAAALAASLGSARARRARAAADVRNPVACQTNAWQIKPGDFDGLLARAEDLHRLGYEAFECNVRFVKDQFAHGRDARARIEKTGVRFYGSHVGLGTALDELERLIDGVAALGATRFVLSGSNKPLYRDGKLDEAILGKKVESISRLARRCKQAGLRLAYHNHRQEFAGNGAEMEALLARTDPALVYLLLDIGHAHRAQADLVAFFTRHHARIDALHLRDLQGETQVPLGKGELPLAPLAAAIRTTSWPGYLTLEEENLKTRDPQRVETVLQADRKAIRETFGV